MALSEDQLEMLDCGAIEIERTPGEEGHICNDCREVIPSFEPLIMELVDGEPMYVCIHCCTDYEELEDG